MSRAGKGVARLWQRLVDLPALRRSPLLQPDWYRATYPDIGAMDPAWHYLIYGASEGRDPGPGFSTSGYGMQGSYSGNALLHYHRRGAAEGRRALPVFDGTVAAGQGPVILFAAHQVPRELFGAERSFLDMLDRARSAGIYPVVIVPHLLRADYLEGLRVRAARIHVIPYGWRGTARPSAPETLAAFAAVIAESGAVELHQNTLAVAAPLQAARAAGLPNALWLREIPINDAALLARLQITDPEVLRKSLWREADRIIANSTATAAWVDPDGAQAARLEVVPNPIPADLFDLPYAPQSPLRVGLVGSLTAKKGILAFRDLAQAFYALGGEAEFLLIGPMNADLAAILPLPPGMRHCGPSPSPSEAMAQIDLLVSLSLVPESFGRTVTEAMAAGRPVLCNDLGAPPHLVGDAGLVIASEDIEGGALALLDLSRHPARLAHLSARARARAGQLDAASRNLAPERIFGGLNPVTLTQPVP